MRAAASTGPRVLRLGWARGGRIVEERILPRGASVTVGNGEACTFVLPGASSPRRFVLFEPTSEGYALRFSEKMDGRVVLPSGVTDLSALKSDRYSVGAGVYRIVLGRECRGKVTVADSSFLFQLVVPPPHQPRPQLPISLVRGTTGVDWPTTIIAAASFLAHFFVIGSAYSDWLDDVVDDDIAVASVLDSVVNIPRPTIEVPDEAAREPAKADTADAPSREPPKSARAASRRGASSGQEGVALSQALQTVMATVGYLQKEGSATEGVLRGGEVPTTVLDAAARSNTGVGFRLIGEGGTDRIRPGAERATLSDLGNDRGLGGRDLGEPGKAPPGPRGTVDTSHVEHHGADVPNAARVVASLRAGFRACYNRALAQSPDAAGKIGLTIRVGLGGEVTSVGTSPSGNLPDSLVGCIRSRALSAQFDPPAGGLAVVQVPVSFVKQ